MSAAPSPSAEDPRRVGRGLLTHGVGAGRHALNRPADVRTVQHLLNLAMPGVVRLEETGRCDGMLVERIRTFQVKVLHFQTGDGRVDPGGHTLAALLTRASEVAAAARPPAPPPPWYAGYVQSFDTAAKTAQADLRQLESYVIRARTAPAPLPRPKPGATPGRLAVTADQLRAVLPGAGARADAYAKPLNDAMHSHGIDTPEQVAAFLAQISVESGDLHRTEENLNYSAVRLTQVKGWRKRFPTLEAAKPYAHNPQKLANHVYADRMGNGSEASGDGYRYRGRGLMQVTGREGYRAAGFESDPDALTRPETAADSAAAFWERHGLNAKTRSLLDRSHFDGVSAIVNGGPNGAQERWDAYQRAIRALHCRGDAN